MAGSYPHPQAPVQPYSELEYDSAPVYICDCISMQSPHAFGERTFVTCTAPAYAQLRSRSVVVARDGLTL